MKWHPNDEPKWLSESARESLEMWVVIFIICALGAAVLACFWCGGMAYERMRWDDLRENAVMNGGIRTYHTKQGETMTIRYEELEKYINGHHVARLEIEMEDYLKNTIRIRAYDNGEHVSISKADWTDITGWRVLHSGSAKELDKELHRLCMFPGELTDIYTEEAEGFDDVEAETSFDEEEKQ